MARSNDPPLTGPTDDDEIWGTWEELLLACAVNRHGPHSWDSVADELRLRSPFPHLLTADTCRLRFRHLSLRFSPSSDVDDDGLGVGANPTADIPWLDQLRNIRLDELRREVHRRDVSIGSLQLKVKRLTEERERSLREGDAANGSGSGDGSGSDPAEKNPTESQRSTPEIPVAATAGGGVDSGRSCKESNDSDLKEEQEEIKKETDHPLANGSRSRSEPLSGASASHNGAVKPSESVAESRGVDEAEGVKETSDVQSSMGLSRRRRGGRRRRTAVSSGEPEGEGVGKVVGVESQPLIEFLDRIRSCKDGLVFDHRLESQKDDVRYRSLIRRHVDLEMVRNRIGRKGYRSADFFSRLAAALQQRPRLLPQKFPRIRLSCSSPWSHQQRDSVHFADPAFSAVHKRSHSTASSAT